MRVITKVNVQVASIYACPSEGLSLWRRPNGRAVNLSAKAALPTPYFQNGQGSTGGVLAITRTEGLERNWRDRPYPGEKSPEKDQSHNQHGKGIGDKAGVGWAHSSDEGRETFQSQGALLQEVPQSKQGRET